MADSEYHTIPTHPIAPRIKDHQIKPYVGPDFDAYRAQHAKTIGPGSDEWWAQVCLLPPTRCRLN